MFWTMPGNLTMSPSRSLCTFTWQPSRLVSVTPVARSSISLSCSPGSSIPLYIEEEVTITWQVLQAHSPSQAPVSTARQYVELSTESWGNAPSISRCWARATSRRLAPSATSKVCESPTLLMKVTWRLLRGRSSATCTWGYLSSTNSRNSTVPFARLW